MSIELAATVEDQLRSLASKQGRDVQAVAEEAVRQYLEAADISDVDAGEVAETQTAMLAELPAVTAWKAGKA